MCSSTNKRLIEIFVFHIWFVIKFWLNLLVDNHHFLVLILNIATKKNPLPSLDHNARTICWNVQNNEHQCSIKLLKNKRNLFQIFKKII
jgi:hypothetical protein